MKRALWGRRLGFFAGLIVALGLFHEAASRIAHKGVYPLLPYIHREGAAFLPADADLTVAFGTLPAARYFTDAAGARIAAPSLALPPARQGVLVVGDSQALGYMMRFDQSFGARLAQRLSGDAGAARLLAAPATDLDAYPVALFRFNHRARHRWALGVLTVNLGNDLEEMALRAAAPERYAPDAAEEWLLNHSFAYMDWVVFRENRVRGEDDALGLNRILFWMDSPARVELVRLAAARIESTLTHVDADRKLVLIIPSDYQVDPSELEKYRHYYRDQAVFRRVMTNGPVYAAMMNPLEHYLAQRLRSRGITVVRFSDIAMRVGRPTLLFDRQSHHLTPYAHALIAAEIARTIRQPSAPATHG